MKFKIYKPKIQFALKACLLICLLMPAGILLAQDDSTAEKSEEPAVQKVKPVKNTFQSVWLIDNQTVLVPVKGTFEMDIMHRFGTVDKGYEDFWGFFAPSNIRMGVSFVPINKLNIGIGVTKSTATILPRIDNPGKVSGPMWDASLKYSIITQTKGKYPVSVSYYANVAINTKKDTAHDIYLNSSDRLSYFHQLLIARKITDKLSIQVAPSVSHQNVVNGFFEMLDSSKLNTKPSMEHNHIAIAISARYKLTKATSVMVSYDQPITKHVTNNPNPNLSFGLEFNTSSHSFQLFMTNYFFLTPQTNNLYNHNSPFDYKDAENKQINGGKFLIGFNITRLWNY